MKEFDHQNVMRLLGESDHALKKQEHLTYSNMDFSSVLPNTVTGHMVLLAVNYLQHFIGQISSA